MSKLAFIKQRQVTRGNEAYTWTRFGVLYITFQDAETSLGIFRRAPGRFLPLVPFRIRSQREIQIPKCRSNKFGWMVVSADHASVFGFQVQGGAIELFKRLGQLAFIVEGGAELVLSHVEDVKHSAKPEWLFADSDVLPFIQIYGNAHAQQRAIRLRRPGATRLAIAARYNSE